MPQGVRVFLCSTYEDLVDERKAVLGSLDNLRLAHESMEYFGARPSPGRWPEKIGDDALSNEEFDELVRMNRELREGKQV